MGAFDPLLNEAKKRASGGDLSGALKAIDAALALVTQAQLFRARLLQATHRPDEALEEVRRLPAKALSLKVLEFRLQLEEGLGQMAEAAETLGDILEVAPNKVGHLMHRASCLRAIGAFDEAIADIDAALVIRPQDGQIWRLRGELTTAQAKDGFLDRMREVRAALPEGSKDQVQIDFALAKAHHDLGDFDAAMAALAQANDGMRAHYPYDAAASEAQTQRRQKVFAEVRPKPNDLQGATRTAPIFVTGLPRSGTTLVEHVLSHHGDVIGLGETGHISSALRQAIGDPDAPTAAPLDLSDDAFRRMGALYAKSVQAQVGSAPRYTDKSLQTLDYAGPTLAAMPRAHIVVVRRDPHATALSLYRQVFRPGKHLFSYSLEDIRRRQIEFDTLLAFWADRLTERFHIIDYEDIVRAPEPTIRALLEAVDLPWDPACLRPEDNGRPVQTLSAVAVRAPINTDALNAWRPYARLLASAE